jgi:hypothetical protein
MRSTGLVYLNLSYPICWNLFPSSQWSTRLRFLVLILPAYEVRSICSICLFRLIWFGVLAKDRAKMARKLPLSIRVFENLGIFVKNWPFSGHWSTSTSFSKNSEPNLNVINKSAKSPMIITSYEEFYLNFR